MKGVNTNLSVFSPKTQQLLDEARGFLKESNEDQLIQLASRIPRGATDGNEKINIAFAGQYRLQERPRRTDPGSEHRGKFRHFQTRPAHRCRRINQAGRC